MGNVYWKTVKTFAVIIGGVILFLLLVFVLPAVSKPYGMLLGFGELFVNGWALYAFLRYRQGRQEELLQVLLAASEAGMPLVSAVNAYRHDRPQYRPIRNFLRAIAFFALPIYGYVRLWIGVRSYDRLLEIFVHRLESGASLSRALAATPGVASREARLAAEVGEATGKLALSLRTIGHNPSRLTWLEVAPRLVYPAIVLVMVVSITTFVMVAIIPKYQRIFQEFGMELPTPTVSLIHLGYWIEEFWWMASTLVTLALLGIAALVALPTLRWHTPIIGRMYRWSLQADVLRTLGRYLGAGRTVPESLGALAASKALPPPTRARLDAATASTTAGEPLAESLRKTGLLPTAMAPLVTAASRTATLPWALVELGEHLSGRSAKLLKRLSLVLSPLAILSVGVLVGIIGLGLFVPLIELMNGLSE